MLWVQSSLNTMFLLRWSTTFHRRIQESEVQVCHHVCDVLTRHVVLKLMCSSSDKNGFHSSLNSVSKLNKKQKEMSVKETVFIKDWLRLLELLFWRRWIKFMLIRLHDLWTCEAARGDFSFLLTHINVCFIHFICSLSFCHDVCETNLNSVQPELNAQLTFSRPSGECERLRRSSFYLITFRMSEEPPGVAESLDRPINSESFCSRWGFNVMMMSEWGSAAGSDRTTSQSVSVALCAAGRFLCRVKTEFWSSWVHVVLEHFQPLEVRMS